ncbi:MAG TPA: hypothetical protein PKK99_11880, partial [Bacteroidia bacterium]|nr:hypothetical protein [Bacteroidia bacterium]
MKRLTFLLFLTLSITSFAQNLDFSLFKNYKPRSIGPAAMSGRVTAIAGVNSNPNILYLGAASGGVWKSTNGGTTWEPIFDNEKT